MNTTLIKWTGVVGLLIAVATSALAGSVTLPGETIGAATGEPAAPGFYFADDLNYGRRDMGPQSIGSVVNIPILVWSTPWKVLGARIQASMAPVSWAGLDGAISPSGLVNPFVAGQLAWDLGKGWGFSYLLGGYFEINSPLAVPSDSINQRFAISYTGNNWNLTANTIWGIQMDSVSGRPPRSNPDFLNLDLTATKRFGRLEVGPVGFFSSDLNSPGQAYKKQSQFAMGGLVGYWTDKFIIQAYVTSDVYENNYGGNEVRGFMRIIIPLGNINGPTPKARPVAY